MIAIDDYVVDVLMRDLVGHDRRPVCFLVMCGWRRSRGGEEAWWRLVTGRWRRGLECRRVRCRGRWGGW